MDTGEFARKPDQPCVQSDDEDLRASIAAAMAAGAGVAATIRWSRESRGPQGLRMAGGRTPFGHFRDWNKQMVEPVVVPNDQRKGPKPC